MVCTFEPFVDHKFRSCLRIIIVNVSESANVERIGVAVVQLAFEGIGFLFREQPISDYGIDAHVEIVQGDAATGRLIGLQIKSGSSWFEEKTENGVIYRGDKAHLDYWLNHSLPVIIVLYDPEAKLACWQVVNNDTVTVTGKGWKLEVPMTQTIDEDHKDAFGRLAESEISDVGAFTILELRDVSHGLAKRYSANVLIPEGFETADIPNVIKQLTYELRGREYYRTDTVRKRWAGHPAQVVFLFIYRTLDDVRNTNWICRSLWIDSELTPEAAPTPFEGDEIGEGIVVDWSSNYEVKRKLADQYGLTKEDFLLQMQDVLIPMEQLIVRALELQQVYESGGMREEAYQANMMEMEPDVTELYTRATGIGMPPFECLDLARRFQSVAAYAHNIFLPFSERGLETWPELPTKQYLIREAIEKYLDNRTRLDFELEKVR